MKSPVTLVQGDITRQHTDAIVNAANSSLMGGGGVDGAIHRAGGPEILAQCKEIVAGQGRLPAGQAVITSAGNLPCKFVIHTVGPIWRDGQQGEGKILADAWRNSLQVASENGVKSICFPSISTGAYRFPIRQAAEIAVRTINEFLAANQYQFREIRIVLFTRGDLEVYREALSLSTNC